MKVHKISLFLIRFPNTERSSSFSNLHNAFSASFPLYLWVHFSYRAWYCESTQDQFVYDPNFPDWKIELLQQPTQCISVSCLVYVFSLPTEPDIMKVHKVTLLMTRIPNTERHNYFRNLRNDHICPLRLGVDFFTDSDIMVLHTAIVFMTRLANAERPSSFNENIHTPRFSHQIEARENPQKVSIFGIGGRVPQLRRRCVMPVEKTLGDTNSYWLFVSWQDVCVLRNMDKLRALLYFGVIKHRSILPIYFEVTPVTVTAYERYDKVIGYSTVCSAANSHWYEENHQSSASLFFVKGINQRPVDFLLQRASEFENVSMSRHHHVNNTGTILRMSYFQFTNPKIW